MINRRNFIKALSLVPFIDWDKPVRFKLMHEPSGQWVDYLNYQMNMYVSCPSKSVYIDNITIPEGY